MSRAGYKLPRWYSMLALQLAAAGLPAGCLLVGSGDCSIRLWRHTPSADPAGWATALRAARRQAEEDVRAAAAAAAARAAKRAAAREQALAEGAEPPTEEEEAEAEAEAAQPRRCRRPCQWQCVSVLRGHTAHVTSVFLPPASPIIVPAGGGGGGGGSLADAFRGLRLASGSVDNTIRIWRADALAPPPPPPPAAVLPAGEEDAEEARAAAATAAAAASAEPPPPAGHEGYQGADLVGSKLLWLKDRALQYADLQELWDPAVRAAKEARARRERAAAAKAAGGGAGAAGGGQQQPGGNGAEGEQEEEAVAAPRPPFPAFLSTRALAALSPPGETVELLGGGPGLGYVAAMTDKQRLYLFACKFDVII
ncbi:hypothetical protein HXX76_011858 [Chlamydomonas incerta]|uniref:Uncharacterized protein n=1 Tax=Chlamydomonas incerta TaxID=51695 RepID=A0A835SR33_CHLIN|nr:hypothetical protein HXX76_011858 [Chlamydomonas incerta]|eukprot:KAG2428178.1 hypothetical protein HXX76_011858 [Chlamydomonas incerta]